jgi:hypothetical protein
MPVSVALSLSRPAGGAPVPAALGLPGTAALKTSRPLALSRSLAVAVALLTAGAIPIRATVVHETMRAA